MSHHCSDIGTIRIGAQPTASTARASVGMGRGATTRWSRSPKGRSCATSRERCSPTSSTKATDSSPRRAGGAVEETRDSCRTEGAAPSFAEQGELGEERWLRLELKLVADVALVGFPNVGKSTLISVMSAAKPKIADYPFTTLEPNLGVVRIGDMEYVVADVPGLIEGASEGRGLGHQFLRHVERARVLCVLADLAWQTSGAPEPTEQVRILLQELERHQPDLLARPRIIVGSRADIGEPPEPADAVELSVSAVTGDNVSALTGRLAQLVSEARAAIPKPEAFVVHRPVAEGFRIEAVDGEGGGWRVVGRQAERAVALSDLTNPEALAYAEGRLKSLGVDRALGRAGAAEGDLVRIGSFTFEYGPDDQVLTS